MCGELRKDILLVCVPKYGHLHVIPASCLDPLTGDGAVMWMLGSILSARLVTSLLPREKLSPTALSAVKDASTS